MEHEFGNRIKEGAKKAGKRVGAFLNEKGERAADRFIEAAKVKDEKNIEAAILNANPNKVLKLLIKKYEQKRRTDLGKEFKNEPSKEERKIKFEELEEELKNRRDQNDFLQEDEKERRKELEEELKTEPDEEHKKEQRGRLEKKLIKNREGQRKEDQQMTFINEEEHPVGFAQRTILKKRVERVATSGASISDSEYLRRGEEREKRLNELYVEKSKEEKTLPEQRKKEIESEIDSLKKEVEREMLKLAAALNVDNLRKVGDAINVFTDSRTKQEMHLNGEYEPIGFKWAGGEAQARKKQVREMLEYSLKETAIEMANTKKWYEEAKFEKRPYEIGIEPKKPSDKKMRNESVRMEHSERKEWADLRIEEYAKSQKLVLKILERMNEAARLSLEKDPEARNLSAFFKENPGMGQDWLKIKEAARFQNDIKESFHLEIAEQRKIQILKNTVKQDLQDILYRNFIDMFRGVGGPIGNILKRGLLVSGKEVGALLWNVVSGGAEFFLKETLVSPVRFGIKFSVGGGGAIEKGIRKRGRNEKVRKKIEKGINT